MSHRTSWLELIEDELRKNGETWSDVVSITLTAKEVKKTFEIGYKGPSGRPFTAWTADHVYFPLVYDGSEWCGSAPRNPNGVPLSHQGGC